MTFQMKAEIGMCRACAWHVQGPGCIGAGECGT